MFLLSAENANRAGLVANITVKNKRVIHIADHKTYGGKYAYQFNLLNILHCNTS